MSKKKKSKKNNKKKTKQKKAEAAPTEILESVADSMEMAGTAMDFFEQEPGLSEHSEESQDPSSEPQDDGVAMEASEEATSAEEEEQASLSERSEEPQDPSSEPQDDVRLSERSEESEESSADFVDDEQAFSIIESLLFASDKPLGVGTFKQVFHGTNIKTKEIKKLLEDMQSVYADSTRGVELFEVNGGWQLRTKVDNMPFLRKLAKSRPFKLSGPALEVLAILAYKQPLVKMEVDQIRGVESGHLVRALMEKGLVCFQGKSELPGKPMQYGTTRKFLEIFGLRNLKELPSLDEIDQLLPDGIGMEEEEKLSDVTDSLSEQYDGNYSEGEEELLNITEALGDIDTSSDFFEEEKRRQREKRDRDRAQDIREALEVGEEVAEKDKRWLARYDEKLAEEQASLSEHSEESEDLSGKPQDDVRLSEHSEESEDLSGKPQDDVRLSERSEESEDPSGKPQDDVRLSERSEESEDLSGKPQDDGTIEPQGDEVVEFSENPPLPPELDL